MKDFTEELRALRRRLDEASGYLDRSGSQERLRELEAEVGRPDLWDDVDVAKKVTSEYGRVKADVELLDGLDQRISDTEMLYELGVEESDDSVEAELTDAVTAISRDLDALELRSLFSGEYDEHDAVCEIHAGAGGTDAHDWAEMMLRMYMRWAERRGFTVEVDEASEGQEAGLMSATFIVKGRFAYGLLQAEQGTHRLVRISPFDQAARRQTSFASMGVTPFTEDLSAEVNIDEKDIRIDVYRSSGAGGQHVNVTDSAVRITHFPTGIVVSCQNERSQLQNKARAMQVLAAKIVERQRQERLQELEAISGPMTAASWGTQIRSYVLAPYQLVKDLRTEYETGNVQQVLDGDLDAFMEAWLRFRRTNPASA